MLENIINIIREKYNVSDINYKFNDDNFQLLKFYLNAFAIIKIYKICEDYHLTISISNSNTFPSRKININLKYNSYERLLNDLEYYNF